MPPALNIPVRVTLNELKAGLKETTSLTGSATKQIAKQFIDANASILKTAGGIGTAVGAARTFLGILGPLAVAITAVKGVFELMGYATDLAKEKIEDFYKTAERAGKAGVTTDFFQRMTKSGEALKLTVDDVNDALDRFASKSQGRLGGSDLDKRLAELTGAGNFAGNVGVAAVGNALGTEAKLRATVDLITEALAKGERLAALDLAEKTFGPKIADNLRANSNYLREMLDTADKLAASKIVSDEEIGRAVDLKNRLEDAQKVLAERFKPVQDDLATLGMNYHQNWVELTELMAKAVGIGNDLYAALKEIPDIFARAGSASFWTKLTELTGNLGLNSDSGLILPGQPGFADDPAISRLGGLMRDPAAVRRAMQQAIDIETKVRGDQSKAPASATATPSSQRDPFETAIDQGNRRIAIMNAETATIGQNSEARERARIVAQLEEAAKRANAEAGRELYGVTEATNPKITEQADRMLAAAKAAREQHDAFQGVQDALRYAGNTAVDIIDRLGQRGTTFGQTMADVFRNLSRQMLLAAITGEGAFAKLFGMAGGNGSVGGIMGGLGSMFTGGSGTAASTVMVGSYAMPMFAAGTDNAPGGLAIVGEKGREIVNLPRGSQVVPNHITEALLKGIPAFANDNAKAGFSGGMSLTTIAPQIAVTVQGQPGASKADHQQMGETIAKQIEPAIRALVGKELRMQMRPGGILK